MIQQYLPRVRFVAARLLALFLMSATCLAGGREPGSLLVFAEFDTRPGSVSFVTVTNVHQTEPIGVTFRFRDPDEHEVVEVREELKARDTLTLLASAVVPVGRRGYCFAYATQLGSDPEVAVDFDHLVGSSAIFEGLQATEYRLNAMVYEGLTGHGMPTDNGNDVRDLDGVEYEAAPATWIVPQFFGQDSTPGMPNTELILIPLLDTTYTTTVSFRIHNDDGQAFGAQRDISSWSRIPLNSVSPIVRNDVLRDFTAHDPGEIRGFGRLETGWITLWGAEAYSDWFPNRPNPAILAAVIELGPGRSAYLPFSAGENASGELHTYNTIIGAEQPPAEPNREQDRK